MRDEKTSSSTIQKTDSCQTYPLTLRLGAPHKPKHKHRDINATLTPAMGGDEATREVKWVSEVRERLNYEHKKNKSTTVGCLSRDTDLT